ncbi:MAG: hypothetical protein JW914_04925 [Syntrophaceae bacterium]|nr:hypothetical protein [Syntrophaceae bacterium]
MKKYLLIFTALILAGVMGLAIYNYKAILGYLLSYPKYQKSYNKAEQRFKDELLLIENKFKENPNYKDGLELMVTYYHTGYEVRSIDKSVYYAKQCLELGIENADPEKGLTVLIHLAMIYKQKGQVDLAKCYIRRAFALDKNNFITEYNTIEHFGLQDLLDNQQTKAERSLGNQECHP